MLANLILISAAVVGVNAGWERLPDGGMKCVIQIDAETLEALKAGETLQSDLPANVRDIRSFSLEPGTGAPRRDNPPPAREESATPSRYPPDAKSSPSTPPPLLQDAQGKPLASQAGYNEPVKAEKTTKEPETTSSGAVASDAPKPWLPLTLVSLLLFASIGANAYLLWIFAEIRRRYRALVAG